LGFFTKNGKADDANATTIITSGTTIRGDIEQKCNMHIDGIFEGKLQSNSEVIIDKNGKVEGELIANRVIVSGNVNGTIKADTIEILPGGKVNGEVEAVNLIIEPKGVFEGVSKVKREVVATNKKIPLATPKDKKIETSK